LVGVRVERLQGVEADVGAGVESEGADEVVDRLVVGFSTEAEVRTPRRRSLDERDCCWSRE